ncbi:MAG: tetratricopeptide repeat protein [Bacteroidota bacterium]
MMKITRICGFVAAALILQMHGELIAQTIDEGISLLQQRKFAEARTVFEQILDKDENNAEAHYRLGLVYSNRTNPQRDVDKAVDELEKAVDLKPDSANYQFRYGVALGEKTQKAGIIKQAFLAPKVKNAFKRAVELNPQHAQARIALAQFYLIAPSIVGGNEEEGWKQLDEAIKLDEVPARSVKASFLERAKKNDEAEKEYKILVVSKPKDWRTWKNYGYFCMNAERYDAAVGNFKKYIELCPDTADSYQSLAEALLKKGETDLAMTNLNKSLSLDKDYVPAIILVGEVYQAKGQKKEAKDAYQRALSVAQNEYYKTQAEKKLKEVE